MKKIKITDYLAKGRNIDIKESIASILFHPMLQLNHLELFRNSEIMAEIKACTDEYIILADPQYKILEKAVETIRGWSEDSIELVGRIINAETVKAFEKIEGEVAHKLDKEKPTS